MCSGKPNSGNNFSVSRNVFQAEIRPPDCSRTMTAQAL